MKSQYDVKNMKPANPFKQEVSSRECKPFADTYFKDCGLRPD